MDPNAALDGIRSIVGDVLAHEVNSPTDAEYTLDDLANRVRALDEWLSRGGFAPAAWVRGA